MVVSRETIGVTIHPQNQHLRSRTKLKITQNAVPKTPVQNYVTKNPSTGRCTNNKKAPNQGAFLIIRSAYFIYLHQLLGIL